MIVQSIQPDRPEIMNAVADASAIEIVPGVVFRPLVGQHNQARNLTTGIVTFGPRAQLPYHTHPFAESITPLKGLAVLKVEGRVYQLGALDNACIPRDTAHAVENASGEVPAIFHIAMASASPTRALVERAFAERPMPEDGHPSTPERVGRHVRMDWYEPSPQARFQDYFNRELGCTQMSGGYGVFAPGARLPCHLHDFDESICIIEGTATCVVEGRRYPLSDCGTALVPRGRCHYFINETARPMAMIWVYAGPMPERIVLDERCCSVRAR